MSEQTIPRPPEGEGKILSRPEIPKGESSEIEKETGSEGPEFAVSPPDISGVAPDILSIPEEKNATQDFRDLMGVGKEEELIALQILANPSAYSREDVAGADELMQKIILQREQGQRNKNE